MWDGEGGAGGEGGGSEGGGGEGEGSAVDWRAGLSDELRAAPALADISNVGALAQNYIDQANYLGNAIRPPGPEASPEQKKEFYAKIREHAGDVLVPRPDPEDQESLTAFSKAMGLPDKPDGYTTPQIENFNPQSYDAARETFHKLGLTDVQAQGLAAYRHQEMTEEYNAVMASHTEQHAALQQEWGMTYQPRMDALGNWLVAEKAPPAIAEAVKQMPTDQIKFLHSIMTRLGEGEGKTQHQQGGADGGGLPPAEALERAAELMARLTKMNPGDPAYAGLAAKRLEYMKMAYPDSEVGLASLRSGVDPTQITA